MVEFGYKEVETKSTKYRRFVTSVSGEKYRSYLLGRNGNVRSELMNEYGKVVQTVSVTEIFQMYVVKWEERIARDVERKARIAE
jgi:hypothetical protein